ncbi:hypothetical protein I3760_04G014500 [Carya illinoinensis]|nr:hypothetical protein I3760_04G014500 [Carya illinoinensis]
MVQSSIELYLETGTNMGHLKPDSGTISFNGERKESPAKNFRGALACMVNSEIGAVLAVMRRNVRWGVRYVADDDKLEHSLIHSLKELRKKIFSWQNKWHNVDPAVYLQPFLDVIQSDETGAPITGVALSSVYKILSLDILNLDTVNVGDAMHLIVDAVTSCRFEVTDPASEEVVLMKILQVLLACMKSTASVRLSNQHVCNIVNTCFRVVHQASSKGELLQRIARHTMHELVRCIFSHLPDIDSTEHALANGNSSCVNKEVGSPEKDHTFESEQLQNGDGVEFGGQSSAYASKAPMSMSASGTSNGGTNASNGVEPTKNDEKLLMEPYGVPSMVEIFHFLCSLLNAIEHIEFGPQSNPIAYDEDVPLFALGLINSAIELGGPYIGKHPQLLAIVQDELFRNLMQYALSMSPLILSTVCSIVLNLYHHLRTELKVQLEAFLSCVLLRLAQSKHGSSYQLQEVAMEALVDLCRQHTFMAEMYANFDCDITCSNMFEDLANLLSKSAFPVNGPLSAMHILALDGLISMVQGMAERLGNEPLTSEPLQDDEGYKEFWTKTCENYSDPNFWVPFVRKLKYIKRKLMVGADHFNRDPKKGLEFLQGMHLLPEKLDPQSVACLFRYTTGLDKNLVGDFLGNHDEFCVQVLHEFARTFDFQDMSLDTALRLFLGTFRLPGESQKIQRVLEAFAERYYEQSPHILINKDAALVLSYSLILLNTDQHNAQVKKKMTEEDFIRNNRRINGGMDLPRGFLSELYRSICENEIQMIPDQNAGFPVIASSQWINVIYKSRKSSPFIVCDSTKLLTYDMFTILSGPTIAALSVIFDQVEQEDVLQTCIDSIFMESKFLRAESLLQLVEVLISAAGRLRKVTGSIEDEDTVVFCLELLIAITLNNRDRIMLIWKGVYEHISDIVQSTIMPCMLVEKAVFGLLKICQRLLPYKENLTDELLRSLQLVLKLDARVADAYCEHITQEVMHLVKANATHVRSHTGWRTIISLLSITARHPEASEVGFEALAFIMSDGAHLLPSNYVLCVDAARQFAESRVGEVDLSISALDMMAGSVVCLVTWSCETKIAVDKDAAVKVSQDIGEMWLRLVQGLRKVCLDQREEVRNHAILMLQRCLAGVDGIQLPNALWLQCFDLVIFTLLDDLLETVLGKSPKDYRNMEGTLVLAMKLMSKVFLHLLLDLWRLPSFCKLWLGILNRMERYMNIKFRGRRGEKMHELIPELLKDTLLVMKTTGLLTPSDTIGGDSFWQLTWLHVKNISPSLQSELFPAFELEQQQSKQIKAAGIPAPDGTDLVRSSETTA